MNFNNTNPFNFMGNNQYPNGNAIWPAGPVPGFVPGFVPQQPPSLPMDQFPPNTPIHLQLSSLRQLQKMVLAQKETHENFLKIDNEHLDKLQTRIQELENSEELQTTVVMQKAHEALNSGKATEEMKAAFEVLKKLFIK